MEVGKAHPGLSDSEDPALAELREAYAGGDLVVFAGSAISTTARLPSWSRLAGMLADHPRMQQDPARREELLGYLQRRRPVDALTVAEQVLGRSELAVLVERMLNDQDLPVPPLAQAIAALAPRLKAVLTTNIDHLLERAFARQWAPLWKAPVGIVQRRAFILKLHGTLLDRSSWVFTRADYDRATWGHGNIRETLSVFFKSFPLLFVGHDLEGEDFESVLAQVRALAGEHPPRHFALVPSGTIPGVQREGLERAGIRLIEYANTDGQHAEASRLLTSLGGGALTDAPAPRAIASSLSSPTAPALSNQSPFPGLEHFDEARAPFFFGRETEVDEALQLLGETERGHVRWLQVEGASGTGKSSFAAAGLLPKVRLGWIGGAPAQWSVGVLRPGRQPLLSLAQAVLAALRPEGVSLEGLAQQMRSSPTALASFLRQHVPAEHGFLLLVDQFEELFTFAEPESVSAFERNVATALEDTDGPLYLVSTLRADFLGHFGVLPGLERLLAERVSRYPLKPMVPLGLQAAIKKPAEKQGLSFEAGLPERLLEDVAGIESGLPLLAHALRELWVARHDQTLTHAAYGTLGGPLGALTRSSDQLLKSLGEEGRKRARQLLLALVTLQGGRASRRSLTRAEALEAAGGTGEAEQVLARLSGGRSPSQPKTAPPPVRLIVVTQGEGQDRVDLVHEALITRWTTFGEWIKEERQALISRDDLEAAARAWQSAGSPKRDLPSGAQLAYLRTATPTTELARQFLSSAQIRERGRRRVLVAIIAVLVVGLLTMTALALFALRQQSLAQQRLSDATDLANAVIFEIDRKLAPVGGAAPIRRELLKSTSKLLDKLREGAQDDSEVLRSRMATHNQRGDLARSHDDLQRARQEYEAALALARRLTALAPNSSRATRDLSVSLDNLGEVARAQGRLEEARTLYEQGLDLAQELVKADPSSVTLKRDLSVSLNNLGDAASEQGRLEEAHSFYQQALDLRQELAKADPASAILKSDLATSLERVGEVASEQGRLEEARSFYQQALDLRQELAKADPSSASLKSDLCVSLNKLGEVASEQGRLEEARPFFQQALDLRQELAKADPSSATLKRDQSVSLNKLGEVASVQGRLEEARGFYQQALGLRQALAKADPSSAILKRDLFASLSKLGEVATAQGQLEEARALYQQALALTQELVKADPSSATLKSDLSISLERLGEVASEQSRLEEARSFYQQALDLRQALAKANPTSATLKHDLSVSLERLGGVADAQGRLEEARTVYQQAFDLRQALVKANPSSAALKRELSVSLENLGEVASAQGRLKEARGFHQQALDLRQALVKADPSNATLKRDLCVSLNKLGGVASTQGRLKEARTLYLQALELRQALVKADPSSATLKRDLSFSLDKLGGLASDEGRPEEARSFYQQALELRQVLVKADPSSATLKHDLSMSLERLGEVAGAQDRLEESRTFFQQAVDLRQALVKADPSNATLKRALSISIERLGEVADAQGRLEEARGFYQQYLDLIQALAEANPSNAELKLDWAGSELVLADVAIRSKDLQALRTHRSNAERILGDLQKGGAMTGHSRYQQMREMLAKVPR